MAVALLIIGAVLLTAGVALYDLRAAICAAGVLVLAAGVDLARDRTSEP